MRQARKSDPAATARTRLAPESLLHGPDHDVEKRLLPLSPAAVAAQVDDFADFYAGDAVALLARAERDESGGREEADADDHGGEAALAAFSGVS